MLEFVHVILVAFSVGGLTMLLLVFIWRWCCYRQRKDFVDENQNRPETLQAGIAQLHQPTLHNPLDLVDSKRRGNYYVFRRGASTKPLFNWTDHPALVTDAVENGWSRFGFTSYMTSPSTRSSLLGICAVGDYGRETQADISWEVCQGSADFMQKIRLNLGLKKVNVNSPPMSAASVIRTALPLPGPPLGNSAFPQEAYFEITILYSRDDQESVGKVREGEKTKLIQENSNANANSESLVHVTSSRRINKIEEFKLASKDEGKGEVVMLSLGLTPGGSLPLRLPGSYPGSIGFNSDGSVYLDGIKLVFESEKAEWGRKDKVIGCGFDPRQNKVFFTVDSELVHVVNCKSEEFGTPLYPTIAANNDVLVLVNFGQSAFTYTPANAQRTSNPCFIGPLVNSPAAALGYEDSKELFSMGRIDSQWLNRSTTKGGQNMVANNRTEEFDEESEADLFEIVLENSEESPNSVVATR
ncbi:Concanavalin A-like lectin/glucanase domain containing protein [Melia azedarach]|uniref:Concanavalin A-like lectin/glucanase domain containing protein n=1 Tax=Melia azedarach TaxID=155640 RepID=A0ACC1WRN5_MELAZ|nr:Concanavalin A-like lectin/glucanase domain containing protein [Melia azedarach]